MCVGQLGEGGDFYLVMNPASTCRVTIILVKYFQDLIAAMIQPTAQLRQEVEVKDVPVLILLFGSRFNKERSLCSSTNHSSSSVKGFS